MYKLFLFLTCSEFIELLDKICSIPNALLLYSEEFNVLDEFIILSEEDDDKPRSSLSIFILLFA